MTADIQRAKCTDHCILLLGNITRKIDSVLDRIYHADLAAAVLKQLCKLLCRERSLGRRSHAHTGIKQRRERCGDAFVVLILQNADESNAL